MKLIRTLLILQKNTRLKYFDRINHNPYSSGRYRHKHKGHKRKPTPPSQSSVLGCADKPFYYQPKTRMYSQPTLRIAIASHIVLDEIKSSDGTMTESIGGPPCYCGITSRRFGFDVSLATKVGNDLPTRLQNILQKNAITLGEGQLVDAPTTKFQIINHGYSRQLLLIDKCKPLTPEDIHDMKVDCWLASPVIDELPQKVL